MSTHQDTELSEVLVWQEGTIGRIRLNRPKALNTITPSMVTTMTKALSQWRDDKSIQAIMLDASGERAFCAGGDIRQLCVLGKSDIIAARRFLYDEYRLNTLIAQYPKPFIAIMDGLTLGGGVGVAAHASHRIVTEVSSLALPETKIGFFPDVGSTFLLSRTPGNLGIYLGVTGAQFNASDALYAGFADFFIKHSQIADLKAAILEGHDLTQTLKTFSSNPEPSKFVDLGGKIDTVFAHETLLDCHMHLQTLAQNGDPWASQTIDTMQSNAPLSMVTAYTALQAAKRKQSLEDCIRTEYRVVYHALAQSDVYEGVRALLIDKDKKPQWEFKTIADVPKVRVTENLTSLGEHEWQADDSGEGHND